MVSITFEHHHDEHPALTEGPFEWIEMIGGNMFGLRPGFDEAEEIAGVNYDATWDAGPHEDDGTGQRKRRHYSRWTISQATPEAAKPDEKPEEFPINNLQREAVQGALGNDELTDDDIRPMLARFRTWETRGIQTSLRNLERQFKEAGGRGVELADEIDAMRATIAYRAVT